MSINTSELLEIIKNNHQRYVNGETFENLMFECNDDSHLNQLIKDQLEKSAINYRYQIWPDRIYKISETGILKKEEPAKWGIADNVIADITNKPCVLIYDRMNWKYSWKTDDDSEIMKLKNILLPLISANEFITFTGHKYSLENRMYTIATTFKPGSGNTIVSLSEFDDLFHKYEVDI